MSSHPGLSGYTEGKSMRELSSWVYISSPVIFTERRRFYQEGESCWTCEWWELELSISLTCLPESRRSSNRPQIHFDHWDDRHLRASDAEGKGRRGRCAWSNFSDGHPWTALLCPNVFKANVNTDPLKGETPVTKCIPWKMRFCSSTENWDGKKIKGALRSCFFFFFF